MRDKTIFGIRVFFVLTTLFGCWLITQTSVDLNAFYVYFFGLSMAALLILTDIYLQGFSLRGLTALTFGLAIGALVAWILSSSPLFTPLEEDPLLAQNLQLVRIILFIALMYLGAVIALRGKDEFNLVIPYVKFVPHGVDVPVVLIDTSALIDGRIAAICAARWNSFALIIPKFVIEELQHVADSSDPQRRERGRSGIETLNELRRMNHLDLRIHDSNVDSEKKVDAKLIFLAKSLKAKLLTTDYNLGRLAEFNGIEWLNINALSKAVNPEMRVGLAIEVELLKPGKEPEQAIGYLPDGSMVVVNNGKRLIGREVGAEVTGIVPTSGGRMIFAELAS